MYSRITNEDFEYAFGKCITSYKYMQNTRRGSFPARVRICKWISVYFMHIYIYIFILMHIQNHSSVTREKYTSAGAENRARKKRKDEKAAGGAASEGDKGGG